MDKLLENSTFFQLLLSPYHLFHSFAIRYITKNDKLELKIINSSIYSYYLYYRGLDKRINCTGWVYQIPRIPIVQINSNNCRFIFILMSIRPTVYNCIYCIQLYTVLYTVRKKAYNFWNITILKNPISNMNSSRCACFYTLWQLFMNPHRSWDMATECKAHF